MNEKLKQKIVKVRDHIKENKEAYVIGAFVGVVVGYEILLRKEKAKNSLTLHQIAADRDQVQALLDNPRGHLYWGPQTSARFGGIELHVREKK